MDILYLILLILLILYYQHTYQLKCDILNDYFIIRHESKMTNCLLSFKIHCESIVSEVYFERYIVIDMVRVVNNVSNTIAETAIDFNLRALPKLSRGLNQ